MMAIMGYCEMDCKFEMSIVVVAVAAVAVADY